MIGVFDSGYGGLSVLKEFVKLMPEYDYFYLGDNARTPYGNKSDEVIYEHTRQAVDFLFKQDCQIVILACHTASAKALRRLQQEYLPLQPDSESKRILGVIIPTIEEAVEISDNKKIGIIGTKATISSKVYEIELSKRTNNCQIFSQACPLLVPFIEENWQTKTEFKRVLKRYLQPLKIKQIDVLILGCTHYALAISQIKEAIGRRVKIIDPAITAAIKLKDYLGRHKDINQKLSKKGEIILSTTDDVNRLKDISKKLLKVDIKNIKKIELN